MRLGKLFLLALVAGMTWGCGKPVQEDRAAAAKNLFDQTVKQYHLPSAEAKGTERETQLARAADGYACLLRLYSDQPYWCAQALRSLASIRAVQGRLDEAVKLYAQVGDKYPQNDWEVLQAWKSAADLLWDAGRAAEARPFYQKIVAKFSEGDQAEVVKVIVRAAQRRLGKQAQIKLQVPVSVSHLRSVAEAPAG